MDIKATAERLRALASGDTKRSKAAQLRDVINDVEVALAAGVSRSAVIEELAKQGLTMTLATFATTLTRIRKKHGKHTNLSASAISQPQKREEESRKMDSSSNPSGRTGSHDPAELDKIMRSTPDLVALAKLGKGTKK